MTYRQLWLKGTGLLEKAQVPESRLDAELLLEHVCGIDKSFLLAHGEEDCPADLERAYDDVLKKRAERIPLQQITGCQDFMGLTFRVNENVLIPRQDTEILVEEILKDLHGGSRILDLCTGSGCILISLLRYSNDCCGVGSDLSSKALQVARQNAQELIPEKDWEFLEGDLFENVTGKFDLLVSNPPYIASAEVEKLMPEVLEHEPRMALDGREDGLYFYRRIVEEWPRFLYGGAQVFFEIGFDQGEAVKQLMKEAGFQDIQVIPDYAGLDRVVCGNLGFSHSGKDGLSGEL